ncbi:MAG: hypothetical protein IJ189_08795, partial [Clostridia bacterium]|nr:hypothetical protein [Clostridia bacterium]
MRKFWKMSLACLCALMLVFSSTGALAEFSPRLEQLKQKDGMTVELTGSYGSLAKLSKASLETVNNWISALKVTLQGQLGGAVTSAVVTANGEKVFSIITRAQEDGIVTQFSPSGNAYLTGEGQSTALSLLTGEEPHIYDPLEIPELYQELAKNMYPLLEGKVTSKTKRARTSVKNAAASPTYVDYVFKADAMN